jgi:fluoride exporter
MGRVLLVAAGGALGSALRYVVALVALAWLGPGFPWGTLAVNLVGSFLIGLVQQAATEALVIGEEARLFLTTGVMGGLTTYSAFSYESVRLFETGAAWQAWLNIVVTTAACLTVCLLGLATGRVLFAPR